MRISRINSFLHSMLALFIRPGDVVVDCTLGNGHDALFLAERAGTGGHLFGFDVQAAALSASRRMLLDAGVGEDRFTLVRGSHEMIGEIVPEGIGAAVYNLGYLPGGDRAVTTTAGQTVPSILDALGLLRPEGIVAVTLYFNHEVGGAESVSVLRCAEGLDHGRFHVLHLRYTNLPKNPPSILIIQRTHLP
jgi:SAM-dependent methyltransferase